MRNIRLFKTGFWHMLWTMWIECVINSFANKLWFKYSNPSWNIVLNTHISWGHWKLFRTIKLNTFISFLLLLATIFCFNNTTSFTVIHCPLCIVMLSAVLKSLYVITGRSYCFFFVCGEIPEMVSLLTHSIMN